MARTQARQGDSRQKGQETAASEPAAEPAPEPPSKEPAAARYLLLFRPEPNAVKEGLKLLSDRAGIRSLSTVDSEGLLPDDDLGDRCLVLDKLAVGVVLLRGDQLEKLGELAADGPVQALRPEGVMRPLAERFPVLPPAPVLSAAGEITLSATARSPDYLQGYRDGIVQLVGDLTSANPVPAVAANGGFSSPPPAVLLSPDYLSGYRDGIAHLVDRFTGAVPVAVSAFAASALPLPETIAQRAETLEETQATWGLQVTNVLNSPWTGRGIRVAILDTGLARDHPDFQDGRVKGTVSFIPGEQAQDEHGHGTHCAGTACGPRQPRQGPRYGIAYEAELYAAKVLSRTGEGPEGAILAGINWALTQGCRLVALPFGMRPQGTLPHAFYEEIGRRALKNKAALIAASGGHSNRALKNIQPVSVPANGTSILGVGALRPDLGLANFSNGGVSQGPGSVDLVGPGVNVYSSWIAPLLDRKISGTSMAACHVVGIAALVAQMLAEANPDYTAMDVLTALFLLARPLPLPSTDVGKGLVQAPPTAPS